jgi:hypothetical protein
MPTPFDNYDKETAKKLLGEDVWEYVTSNRSFMEGDHWQDGAGWVGPAPQTTETGYQETMAQIERAFVSRNVIHEVVERHVGGVLGREPSWGLTLIEPLPEGEDIPPGDKKNIDEAMNFLQEWWDEKEIHDILKEVAETALWAKKGNFRLYIPAGLQEADGTVKATDLKEALFYIHPDHPLAEDCSIQEDEDTKARIGILLYRTNNDSDENFELVYLDEKTGDDLPETIIKLITKEEGDSDYRFTLGGRLTMYQLNKDPLITPQVQQGQKSLNLAVSMIPRNIVTAGFLERVLLNAQMPGEWELDSDGNRVRFVPTTLNVGAGTTNFFRGIDYQEQDPMTGKNRTVLATPSVHWRDPVDTRFATDAKRSHYEDILEEVDQSHILKQQHANASGKSLEQARADFLNSLRDTKIKVDSMGRWLIETTLAMAEFLSGSPGKWTDKYRATFDCRIDPGPVGSDEKTQYVNASEKQIISRRTARRLSGIADVDAEEQLISAQEDSKLALRLKQAEALKAYKDAGVDLVAAARLIGIEGEDLLILEAAKREAEEKAAKMQAAMVNADGGVGDDQGNRQPPVDEGDSDDQ